ncbi:MAG TPA: hypothetical protein VFS43_16530 [Polyangiaceae bacterium]|nr:hypothetical protein [Polyangiaceae bacterium]
MATEDTVEDVKGWLTAAGEEKAEEKADEAGGQPRPGEVAAKASGGEVVAGSGGEVVAGSGGEARQGAFEEMRPEIEAVQEADVAPRRVNMQRAAAVVQTVATRDAAPERRAEFEKLATVALYDITLLVRLVKLALAAWFVREMQLESQYRASNASVPEAIIQRAQARRAAMIRVIEYWARGVAEIVTLLELVRTGSGHQDLANDLRVLARIYRRPDFQGLVSPGAPDYDPADAGEAERLAEAIIRGLGLSEQSEAERWSSLADRTWTLLSRAYEEHRSKGILLFGSREDVAVTYPSLTSAVRSATPRRRAPEAPAPGDGPGGEPGDEPDSDGESN